MPATLIRSNDELKVDLANCRGSEFQDALAKVRSIPGRKYDGDRKLWLLPNEPSAAERAIFTLEPTVAPELAEWVRESKQSAEQELVSRLPDDAEGLTIPWANERCQWQPEKVNDIDFDGLNPHQRAIVHAIADRESSEIRGIIADDMGLGKSLEMLSIVAERDLISGNAGIDIGENDSPVWSVTGKPRLIVCPNSSKGVWAREIHRWLGDQPLQIIDGSTPKARARQLDFVLTTPAAWAIINYEQLRVRKEVRKLRSGGTKTEWRPKEPLFSKTDWAAVIADEIHRAKNRKAAQTRGLYLVRAPIMLAATGTPIMNSPDDLWSLLHWLWPKEYTSYWRFYEQYVEYTEGYYGKVITGVRNPDALRFELTDRLYRRTKGQVLDLPEKRRITVPVEITGTQRKLYNDAETGLWFEVEKAIQAGDQEAARFAEAAVVGKNVYTISNGAARTVRLRQILSSPALLDGDDESAKLDAVVDAITDNDHKPHIVFTEFVATCHLLVERLRKHKIHAESYTGETHTRVRTELEDRFQRGEIQVIVGTIGAMRESITLTAADTVHFVERSWVPGWNEQAEDRCHRIGQANTVTVYIYEAVNTVDDGNVAPKNRLKQRIVNTVLPQDPIKETRQ